jgi:hypothetical protein
MSKVKDITFTRFGRLVALTPQVQRDSCGGVEWLCQCDCGGQRIVAGHSLRRGRTKSCGCLHSEFLIRQRKDKPICGHPDAPHAAYGLCVPCYQKKHRATFTKAEVFARQYEIADLAAVEAAFALPACEICGKDTELHVDHDHSTKTVRGRLCGSHNRGIGLFQDSPELLRKAAQYLEDRR